MTKLTPAQLAEALTNLSGWRSREGLALERSLAFADAVTAGGITDLDLRLAKRIEACIGPRDLDN